MYMMQTSHLNMTLHTFKTIKFPRLVLNILIYIRFLVQKTTNLTKKHTNFFLVENF